ncbi:MAG: metalloregulator ArsR/SmtB family transcription factor [Terrimesophilobacter sp.]
MNADVQLLTEGSVDSRVEIAVEIFRMLADATRVHIVLALRDGELTVNRLAEIVDKTPASVSQHLAKLRLARIVAARQDGTHVFYRLTNEHASRLVADALFQAEHALTNSPAHHRTTQNRNSN